MTKTENAEDLGLWFLLWKNLNNILKSLNWTTLSDRINKMHKKYRLLFFYPCGQCTKKRREIFAHSKTLWRSCPVFLQIHDATYYINRRQPNVGFVRGQGIWCRKFVRRKVSNIWLSSIYILNIFCKGSIATSSTLFILQAYW